MKQSYQSGNFEKAIEKSVKKLKSDPTNEESILYLEASYAKLNRQTMDRIEFLKKEGRPENVLPVYDALARLRLYEDMIAPLLPLRMASKNRNAGFSFIKDEDLIVAKQHAAEYLYASATKLLSTGNTMDARQAYGQLEELKCIYPDYKDASQKLSEAVAKGTNQVYLKIQNNSGAYLFQELEKEITSMPLGDLNMQWVNFYGGSNQQSPDYSIVVNIRQLVVTPDMQGPPSVHTESRTIQDGWQYELDANGNVKKDSSGNDIKVPKYKTIKCVVTEYMQQKSTTLAGTIDFYQSDGNSLLYSYPFSVQPAVPALLGDCQR
jgi:hypothetical protein